MATRSIAVGVVVGVAGASLWAAALKESVPQPGAEVVQTQAIQTPRAGTIPENDEFVQGAYQAGVEGLVLPVVESTIRPQYTSAALRAKIQGTVEIDVVVAEDGTVARARVARSLDTELGLDQAALDAAGRWRFEPGRLNGAPVAVVVRLVLEFRLH